MVATGWVVAVPVLPAAVLGLPALLMVSSADRQIARMDAIAEWTRNLSGVLTAGQGIEAAIQASLRSTPDAIRPEVARLVGRMRSRWSTEQALRAFADDLDDATGDLVCAALILGAAKRGDGLARVLHRTWPNRSRTTSAAAARSKPTGPNRAPRPAWSPCCRSAPWCSSVSAASSSPPTPPRSAS